MGLVYGYARSFTERAGARERRPGPELVVVARARLAATLAARSRPVLPVQPRGRDAPRGAGARPISTTRRLPHSGDFDMWLRTAARWDVGRVNGPVQAHYRVHDANMHLTSYAGWLTDLRGAAAHVRHPLRRAGARHRRGGGAAAGRHAAHSAREALRRARHAARDQGSTDEADGYLGFARETWPAITPTVGWHATAAHAARRQPRASQLRATARRARPRPPGWRRERRWGRERRGGADRDRLAPRQGPAGHQGPGVEPRQQHRAADGQPGRRASSWRGWWLRRPSASSRWR